MSAMATAAVYAATTEDLRAVLRMGVSVWEKRELRHHLGRTKRESPIFSHPHPASLLRRRCTARHLRGVAAISPPLERRGQPGFPIVLFGQDERHGLRVDRAHRLVGFRGEKTLKVGGQLTLLHFPHCAGQMGK